jgi:hypothetical protein
MSFNKNRLRKKKRQPQKSKTSNQDGFFMVKHPFSTVPRDTLIKGLTEIGQISKNELPEKLAKVEEIIQSVDPLHTLSNLSVYGLYGGIDNKGNFTKSYMGDRFNQSHVELLQALILKIPFDQQSSNAATPDVIQNLFDLLPELADSFHQQRLVELENERSRDENAIIIVQEKLRMHTQIVRNWGYLSRVIGIMKRLCEPINHIFSRKTGLSATQLIDLFHHLVRRSEKLISTEVEKLRPVFAEKTVHGMISTYYDANSCFKDTKEDFIGFATENKLTRDQIKSIILSHLGLFLPDIFSFTADEIADETGFPQASIDTAFQKLSLRFGDGLTQKQEFLFLNNPVWIKPVIDMTGGQYFCALPQTFLSFAFQSIYEIIKGDSDAEKKYAKCRADFLESEIISLFKKAFPKCEIVPHYKWRDGAKGYENDLLVKVDSHLILVEAKSHMISWPALRGAAERIKKHVEDTLLEPSIQSLRLANRIIAAREDVNNREFLLPRFPFAFDEINTLLRLSITLEDFATLQTTIHHVRETGWIPVDHPVAPCIMLADLEIVFDTLESTSHKIHYLKRRADLEDHLDYEGDELDLLGLYLRTGFNIGSAEFGGDHFIFTSMSKEVDAYYSALDEGVQRKKPRPRMTQWWWDICKRIEVRDFYQWSDVSRILLSFSYTEQQQLAIKFKRIVKNVMKNWRIPNHICSIIMSPMEEKTDAIAVFAFREKAVEVRHNRMENIASQVFDQSPHVKRCLLIAVNIDRKEYPYSTLVVYFNNPHDLGF